MLANPQRYIVLFAALQAFASLTVDITLPALPQIAQELSTSEAEAQLTVSIFMAGMCLGMLIFGPLSDKYGRRRLLLGGIVLYVAATIGCWLSSSIEQLVIWRFMQAFGGAAAAILTRAIARDSFAGEDIPRVLSLMQVVGMIAVAAAPMLGTIIMELGNWRWIFAALAVFGLVSGAFTFAKIPETLTPELRQDSVAKTFKAYWHILHCVPAVGYILAMTFTFSAMFVYIVVSPFVFMEFYGLTEYQFSSIFAVNTAGILALSLLNARVVKRLGSQFMIKAGVLAGLCAALLIFLAWSMFDSSLTMILVALFIVISCVGLMGANCTANLMSLFPNNAGAAAGLAVSTQFGLGAVIAMVASSLHDGTPKAMIAVIAVCCVGMGGAYLLARVPKS